MPIKLAEKPSSPTFRFHGPSPVGQQLTVWRQCVPWEHWGTTTCGIGVRGRTRGLISQRVDTSGKMEIQCQCICIQVPP